MLADTNRYISAQEPWKLAKTDLARTGTVLYACAEVVRIVALLAQPVLPTSCGTILDLLAVGADRQFTAVTSRLVPGTALPKPSPVFPPVRDVLTLCPKRFRDRWRSWVR